MKRMLALLLAMVLCMSAVSALALESNIVLDSTWPVVNEPISVTIGVVPQNNGEYDMDNVWMNQYLEAMSNLDITWQHIERSSAKERIPLMLTGGTMPDAIMGYGSMKAAQMVQYGVDEGLLYPIDTLLDYMPNFKEILETKPAVAAGMYASDGHIYGVPWLADEAKSYILRFFINNEWLKNVNKEMPTTLDELYDVLVAFRDLDADGDGDPTNEIPASASWKEGYLLRGWILNAYGFCTTGSNTALRYNADGTSEAVYIPYRSEFKDYLFYMNKLWNENLLDPDLFTQTTAQVEAKLTDRRVGFIACSAPVAVDPTQETNWEAAMPLTSDFSATPIQPASAAVGNPGYFFINVDCPEEKAAALANFADAFFTRDMFNLTSVGPEYVEGEAPAMTPEGPQYASGFGAFFNTETNAKDWVFDTANYASSWVWRTTKLCTWGYPGYLGGGHDNWILEYAAAYPDSVQGKYVAAGMTIPYWQQSADKYQIPYCKVILHDLYMSAEDQSVFNDTKSMMDDYVAGMEAKFITGELSIEDEYDNFIKTLEQYGAKEYVELLDKYTK